MWRYREPLRSDYETDQEYMDALAAYEAAEEIYIEECREKYHQEK